MTLLNPRPFCKRGLSVYYQNIQGLIPFTHLSSENPPLNLTKFAELHAYVAFKKPDIVILNETWLKTNIGSKKFFHSLITKFSDRTGVLIVTLQTKLTSESLKLMAEVF